MGRKIPLPKRHFGVTDPLQQREEREEKIKDKINNPPKNIDEQEVSKQFRKFVKLKDDAMSGISRKDRPKKVDDDFKSTMIDIESLRRHTNETDHKFMKRVSNITHQRRIEAEFAAKYKVDIIRNQETGEIKLKKKPKDQLEELVKKRRAEAAKTGKRSFKDTEPQEETAPRLTSLQKMKLKKKVKKQSKADEKARVFAEYQHEDIKFGEIVLAPPSLVTPRKALKNETVARPGQRDLLLSSMLQSSDPAAIKPNKIFKGPVDKTGKRRNLPNSTRVALEIERRNAVDLYRQLKKKQPIVAIKNKKNEDF